MKRQRVLLGERGGWSYWLDPNDRYVYQLGACGEWYGWFCSQDAWERTMHKILEHPMPPQTPEWVDWARRRP